MFNLDPLLASQIWALTQVVLIDLVMAGDNAVAVGLAAAGLPKEQRQRAIMYGLIGAVVTRIAFVLMTVQLLQIIGLLIAGGILLLWVSWKMWRELRDSHHDTGLDTSDEALSAIKKPKTMRAAIIQILVADVSMSLDNVLAVSGAAADHVQILVFGLLLSIALMGVAAHLIANILHKYRWIGYVGVVIIFYVALHMIWVGYRDVVVRTDSVAAHNQFMPDVLDIKPEEVRHINNKHI
jgi:YjbE family integral membrane protein